MTKLTELPEKRGYRKEGGDLDIQQISILAESELIFLSLRYKSLDLVKLPSAT